VKTHSFSKKTEAQRIEISLQLVVHWVWLNVRIYFPSEVKPQEEIKEQPKPEKNAQVSNNRA